MRLCNNIRTSFILLLFLNVYSVYAQNETLRDVNFSIPEVALIDIEPDLNNTISFQIDPSTESGERPEITEAQNQSLWLNYTSAQRQGQNARSVSATITSGAAIDGVTLYIQAGNYQGVGKGTLGIPESQKTLDAFPQTIITGISNCFTGDGVGNGHLLTFNVQITDYAKLYSTTGANFIITYTLTDN